jgi:hypothetical protein
VSDQPPKVIGYVAHSLDELRAVMKMLEELHARPDESGVAITITGDITVNVQAASTDVTETDVG